MTKIGPQHLKLSSDEKNSYESSPADVSNQMPKELQFCVWIDFEFGNIVRASISPLLGVGKSETRS
jgi:hypothetical protein